MTDASEGWRQQLERGRAYEQTGIGERALAAYTEALRLAGTDAERAEANIRVANLHRGRAEYDAATRHSTVAYELAIACGSDDLAAEALNVDFGIQLIRGRLDDAEAGAMRALSLAQSPRVRGITLQNQATIVARRGELARARLILEQSIVAFREARYEMGITISLINAAMLAQDSGDLAEAVDLGDLAIGSARAQMAHDLVLTAVQNQAHVLTKLGQFDKAIAMLSEALGFFTTSGNVLRQAECLEIMGDLSLARDGHVTTARRSFERARDLADRSGDRILADRIAEKLRTLPA